MLHPTTDLSNQVKGANACFSQTLTASDIPSLITAGGVGDGVKMTGETIDRQGYLSAALMVAWAAKLTDTKTFSLTVEVEHADNSSFTSSTTVALQTITVEATGTSSVTEFNGCRELALKLKGLGRYVRFNITGTMSNTATDIALFAATCVLGGADVLPAA